MEEDSKGPGLGDVIRIDDERIRDHLGKIVRGSVEETLNALLEAEADRLCNARRYERSEVSPATVSNLNQRIYRNPLVKAAGQRRLARLAGDFRDHFLA